MQREPNFKRNLRKTRLEKSSEDAEKDVKNADKEGSSDVAKRQMMKTREISMEALDQIDLEGRSSHVGDDLNILPCSCVFCILHSLRRQTMCVVCLGYGPKTCFCASIGRYSSESFVENC